MSLVQQLLYLDWVGILAVVGGSAVGILGVAFGLFNYPWYVYPFSRPSGPAHADLLASKA